MRHMRRLPLSAIGVATLTLGLLLSGCGGAVECADGAGNRPTEGWEYRDSRGGGDDGGGRG